MNRRDETISLRMDRSNLRATPEALEPSTVGLGARP
jgi:hypothetical protein